MLSDRVIIREEAGGYLLYNGDNGGLIHLSHEAYENWILNESSTGAGYEEFHRWLLASGFLALSPTEDYQEPAAQIRDFQDLFYGLRSRRNPLNVLWALTPRCNLKCIYCFPDARFHSEKIKDTPLELSLAVADQLIEAKVLKVTLSGGECLLYPGIWAVAERLRTAGLTVAIISNGAPITEEVAQKIRTLNICVGISLDGPNEQVHSQTRGAGAFRRAEAAINRLLEAGVPVSVLVTLTRHNFDCLEEHVAWIVRLGVNFVTLQDLRPFGTKELYDKTRLTVVQESRLEEAFVRLRSRYANLVIEPSELFICRKQVATGKVMPCPAGDNFAYIDFNGDVFPCTSAPSFKLGNVLKGESLSTVWRKSGAILAFRRLKQMNITDLPGCADCSNTAHCEGGCRGDALFYHGNLYARPSRCPRDMGVLP